MGAPLSPPLSLFAFFPSMLSYRRGADGVVWAESHCFISPDRKHDNRFVVHCIKQLLGRLHAENNVPKRIMFWSDGW